MNSSYPWLDSAWQQLQRVWQNGRFHHALMLCGHAGVGKSTLAEQLTAGLICQQGQDLQPCGQCKSCLLDQAGNHPDCLSLEPQGQTLGIDDIRRASDFIHQKIPYFSGAGIDSVKRRNHD